MNTQRSLAIIVLLTFSAIPAAAEDSVEEQFLSESAPVSRNYVDPITGLIYYYDMDNGTLTPTGDVWGPTTFALYISVDAYRRGTSSSLYAAGVTTCANDYCVSMLVAVVGARGVTLEITDAPDNIACGHASVRDYTSATLGLVTFRRAGWGINHCAPGLACARLYVDSVLYATDCTRY